MDDEIAELHRLMTASSAEFNRAVVDAFQALSAQGAHAELQGLIAQCHLTAEAYEAALNNMLAALSREPAKYAEEVTRIYQHKVLKKQALDSLVPLLKASFGSS